mgnify:CR=1 FL=1
MKLAKELEEMGADSICIKDMSGLLAPYACYNLVTALKKEIHVLSMFTPTARAAWVP